MVWNAGEALAEDGLSCAIIFAEQSCMMTCSLQSQLYAPYACKEASDSVSRARQLPRRQSAALSSLRS